METSINKTVESRINKMVDLAHEIQGMPVAIIETEEVFPLKRLGMLISDYLKENIDSKLVDEHDIDLEQVDRIFNVMEVSGVKFTLIYLESISFLNKESVVSIIYNLENLKRLLLTSIKDYVEDHEDVTIPENKALAVVESKGELIPANKGNDMFGEDVMEQYMFSQLMNSVGSDPMLSILLMQKKAEGKLTQQALTKLLSAMPGGYMRGPMGSMMMMQILKTI